jgi:energy-coupling factor transport system permease protein
MPVVEGSVERSLDLAAAMDSRGFGRAAAVDPRLRRSSGGLVLVGLMGVCVGLYGLLDGATPGAVATSALGVGVVLAVAGLVLGNRGSRRTRYRPDPWRLPEWLVAVSGAATAATFVTASAHALPGMNLMVVPLLVPALPLVATAGALLALLPAWVAPRPPRTTEVIA